MICFLSSSSSSSSSSSHRYAPAAFRAVRAHFGVSEDDFCSSMLDNPLIGVGGDGGASGAFFYFSSDRHFVVKSVTKDEMATLRSMLPGYCTFCGDQPNTLLPRYFMLLKVAVGTRTQDYVRVVVSTNVFDSNLKLDHQFDIKGSTANRWISANEQVAAMEKKGKLPCLKDLNWKRPLALAQSDLDLLHAQVRRGWERRGETREPRETRETNEA